jgi:small subunit ribosomal protein S6e
MAETKLNIGDSKTKKTYNKTLSPEQLNSFIGKKIGEKISGEVVELPGYEFEIRGGSDRTGTPMRKDVQGSSAKKILAVGGVGIRSNKRKGRRIRKRVSGNTIYEGTSQINVAVVKWGKDPIEPVAEEPSEETGEENKTSEDKKEE